MIPLIISIIMLLIGIPSGLPYGYYTLLRLVVCGTAIFTAVNASKMDKQGWMWILGFIALLFNPIIPIHLEKQLWVIIDLIVAIIFFISIFSIGRKIKKLQT